MRRKGWRWRAPTVGSHSRCLVAARGRLCHRPTYRCAARARRAESGHRQPAAAQGLHPPFQSRLAICRRGLPRQAREPRPQGLDGPAWQPLRQRQGRELHEDAQGRGGLPDGVRYLRGRGGLIAPLHRRGLQQQAAPLRPRIPEPHHVRTGARPADGQIRSLNGPLAGVHSTLASNFDPSIA